MLGQRDVGPELFADGDGQADVEYEIAVEYLDVGEGKVQIT